MNSPRNQYFPDEVSPPGETLRDVLDERGMSQVDLAERMGRTPKLVSELINGKAALTQGTALQLERVLGIPARFWSARERAYQEHLTRQKEASDLREQRNWADLFPIKAMSKAGMLAGSNDTVDLVRGLLDFLGIASPKEWNPVYESQQAAFRKSSAYEADPYSLAAWMRAGELKARKIECAAFNEERFRNALHKIRRLTARDDVIRFQREGRDMAAEAGVAVVFVPELPKSRVSGAARWLTPTKALVQLSLRYKRADQVWFSFFHEAAHILLHGKKRVFIDSGDAWDSQEEREANAFAADFLVPQDRYSRFVERGQVTKEDIVRFAKSIEASPGVVVGRLQHDKVIPYNYHSDLRVGVRWS